MPTGIQSLDPIFEGGVPAGSVILLLGDIGGGGTEFVYSSIIHLLEAGDGGSPSGPGAPKEIRYITFTRLKEDVVKEILLSFRADDLAKRIESIRFDDLSEQYFDSSIVPGDWYSRSSMITRLKKRSEYEDTLTRLSEVFGDVAQGSLVVMDSLTDLATQYARGGSWHNLAGFLRGLQRVAKQRQSTIYLQLSHGILQEAQEKEIEDIADAVILFRWEETPGSRRQRVMYIEKFRGVMPHLEERDLVKFAVRISSTGGFEVSNIRVVI
jgi:KaiC/GvpD/RAD55 family RecA-like ATPase